MTFMEPDGTITIENDDGEYTIQSWNLAAATVTSSCGNVFADLGLPDADARLAAAERRISREQAAKLAARYRDVLAALAPRDGIVMHHWHAMRPCERARYVYRKLTFGRRCA